MNARVMVVEDDRDIAKNMLQILRAEGYEVSLAENGQQALDLLRSAAVLPAVIVLDLTMPIMDGFQFRERQLLDPKLASIPVVIMTADGRTVEKQRITTAAASLRKPANVEDILAALEPFCR